MMYLVWSNEHGAWWRPNMRGYTHVIEEAGRYTWSEAQRIVNRATLDGRLGVTRVDPTDGRRYSYFSEVTVLSPESAPEIIALADNDEHQAVIYDFESCNQGTPEGPCGLRKGHPVGPMYPGHDGHLATP